MIEELTREAVAQALAEAPEPTGRIHDYSQGDVWGHACSYKTNDGGLTLSGHLFTGKGPEPGDWLLLANGARTTRYRITGLQWMGDPDDMWEFVAIFDPRTAP